MSEIRESIENLIHNQGVEKEICTEIADEVVKMKDKTALKNIGKMRFNVVEILLEKTKIDYLQCEVLAGEIMEATYPELVK